MFLIDTRKKATRLIQLSRTAGKCEEAVSSLRSTEAGTGDHRDAG